MKKNIIIVSFVSLVIILVIATIYFADPFKVNKSVNVSLPIINTKMKINDSYSKDRYNVYYNINIIAGADPETFEIYDKENIDIFNQYSRDKNNLYLRGDRVSDVDLSSMKFVGSYIVDKYRIHKTNETSKSIKSFLDLDTLSGLDYEVLKDKNGVYFGDFYSDLVFTKIEQADTQSFKLVGACGCAEKSCARYFSDKNRVYVESNFASTTYIDAETFEYLGNYYNSDGMPYSVSYAKDKNNVYYSCGRKLIGADAESFKVLKDGYAYDKNSKYYLGDKLD